MTYIQLYTSLRRVNDGDLILYSGSQEEKRQTIERSKNIGQEKEKRDSTSSSSRLIHVNCSPSITERALWRRCTPGSRPASQLPDGFEHGVHLGLALLRECALLLVA